VSIRIDGHLGFATSLQWRCSLLALAIALEKMALARAEA
jgi:hypothetical protein